MRLNPIRPSDNPLYQSIYCFGSGDDTGGGSAGDFDDSYNQAMGYTDTLGGPGRSDDSGQARQTTAEERAAAPGYDSRVEEEAIKAAGGPDYTNALASQAAFNDAQRIMAGDFLGYGGGELGPSTGDTGSRFDTTTPVQPGSRFDTTTAVRGAPRFAQGPSIAGAMTREQMLGAPRPSAPEDTNIFEDYEFDAANIPVSPAAQVTQAAGVQAARDVSRRQTPEEAALSGSMYVPPSRTTTPAARPAPSLGSPNDIRNIENIVRNNIDLATGLPVSVRQANAPTFGQVPNYDETDYLDLGEGSDLVEARQKAVADLRSRAGEKELFDTGIGYGILDAVLNTTLRPDQKAQQMLDSQGRAVYSTAPDQGVLAVVDPETGNIQPTSGNFFNRELTPVFDQYRRETDGGDSSPPAITAPVAPATCPDGYRYNAETNACEYVGVAAPGATQYTGDPIRQTTQYTGIAGLEPFVLQPSYTAPRSFSPLYNVG